MNRRDSFIITPSLWTNCKFLRISRYLASIIVLLTVQKATREADPDNIRVTAGMLQAPSSPGQRDKNRLLSICEVPRQRATAPSEQKTYPVRPSYESSQNCLAMLSLLYTLSILYMLFHNPSSVLQPNVDCPVKGLSTITQGRFQHPLLFCLHFRGTREQSGIHP